MASDVPICKDLKYIYWFQNYWEGINNSVRMPLGLIILEMIKPKHQHLTFYSLNQIKKYWFIVLKDVSR